MSKETAARQVTSDDLAIAQRIRELRQEQSLSQNEAAQILGISFQQWQKYEQGRNRLSASRLIHVAKILHTTPHDLLGWERNDPESTDKNRGFYSQIDRKASALWHKIQNQKARQALVTLMESLDFSAQPQRQVVDSDTPILSEVEND